MIAPADALISIPNGLREPLVTCYNEIARNFAERRWEPAELNGGKFSEVVYTILDGAISRAYAKEPSKPANMPDACRALEAKPSDGTRPGDRSLRILIPRILPALYEIRNNRGVGHVGGDVDPNFQDAVAVYQMASWVMAELVRIFHDISLDEAQQTVDGLVERKHPLVWQHEDVRRVLDPNLSKGDQALVLLYSGGGWIDEKVLTGWVEYQNATDFRNKILRSYHKDRLIEYDGERHRVRLTPRGSEDVEKRILIKYKV